MVRAAILFFVLALVSMALGMGGLAGMSLEIGRVLLFVFLVLAALSFLVSMISGKKTQLP